MLGSTNKYCLEFCWEKSKSYAAWRWPCLALLACLLVDLFGLSVEQKRSFRSQTDWPTSLDATSILLTLLASQAFCTYTVQ